MQQIINIGLPGFPVQPTPGSDFCWEELEDMGPEEIDAETGLYYYGARYYAPRTSVWLSVDPMNAYRSWTTSYNYVQNNPVMHIDPTGMLDMGPLEPELDNCREGSPPTGSTGSNESVVLPTNPDNLDKSIWIKSLPVGREEGKGHTAYYKHTEKDIWLIYDADSTNNKKGHYHLYEGDGKVGLGVRRFNKNGDLLPKHLKGSKPTNFKPGTVVNLSRAISNLGGTVMVFFSITAIFTDSPQNPIYMMMMPGEGESNRAYQDSQSGLIYEWKLLNNGLREVRYYRDYDYIDGQWRGTGLYRTDHFNESGHRNVNLPIL